MSTKAVADLNAQVGVLAQVAAQYDVSSTEYQAVQRAAEALLFIIGEGQQTLFLQQLELHQLPAPQFQSALEEEIHLCEVTQQHLEKRLARLRAKHPQFSTTGEAL